MNRLNGCLKIFKKFLKIIISSYNYLKLGGLLFNISKASVFSELAHYPVYPSCYL